MTRYSDFVKSYMKKSGKNWSCSVCDIQKGNLYNKHKINISRENSQMGMEDRDAPAPVRAPAGYIGRERSMMAMEDRDAPAPPAPEKIKIKVKRARIRAPVQGQIQVETLQPSPIPPPEPLVPADPNMRTAVPLGLSAIDDDYPENPNNQFRIEIMLALTYLVPKRINVNTRGDKKTYGVFGRDDDGKLISQSEVVKEVKQRLHALYGKPYTGRDATKLADEIVKPGEKSQRIKIMIHFMNNELNIGLPTEEEVKAGDWKFKYYGQFYHTFNDTKSSKKHSNLFRDLMGMVDGIEFSNPEQYGLPDVEVPLSPLKPLIIDEYLPEPVKAPAKAPVKSRVVVKAPVKTIIPSPIPPPMALTQANPNKKTGVALSVAPKPDPIVRTRVSKETLLEAYSTLLALLTIALKGKGTATYSSGNEEILKKGKGAQRKKQISTVMKMIYKTSGLPDMDMEKAKKQLRIYNQILIKVPAFKSMFEGFEINQDEPSFNFSMTKDGEVVIFEDEILEIYGYIKNVL